MFRYNLTKAQFLWQILLFILVFIGAISIKTPDLHSIDELAIYMSAHNLTHHQTLNIPQLGFALWGLRPGESVVQLNQSGQLFTKKSPIMIAVLWPLLAIGTKLTSYTSLEVALLVGPILLASTSVLLFAAACHAKFKRSVSFTQAVLFAFCSLALPYSQTIFGELIAMFAIAMMLWAIARFGWARPYTYLYVGIACAFMLGVNLAYGIVSGAFVLIATYIHIQDPNYVGGQHGAILKFLLSKVSIFAVPLLIFTLMLGLYNWVRFGSVLETGYQLSESQEGFSNPLWWGIIGLWISPARGILFYNPTIILSLLGGWRLYKQPQTKYLSLLCASCVIAVSCVFAMWWQWWGGYGWGPRFLLPLIPIFSFAMLPFIDQVFHRPGIELFKNWRFYLLLSMAMFSFWVQFAGTRINFNQVELLLAEQFPGPDAETRPLLYHHDPQLVLMWRQSPILWHWKLIQQGESQFTPIDPTDASQSAIMQLTQEWRPGDTILHLGSHDGQMLYENNYLFPVFGLPINIDSADSVANQLFINGLADADRVWIVSQFPFGSPVNWYEQKLWQAGWGSVTQIQDPKWTITLLAKPPNEEIEADWQPVSVSFGPIDLTGYRVTCTVNQQFVELQWHLRSQTDTDWTLFAHQLQNDVLIAQQDRFPWNGHRTTSTWAVDEPIYEQFAFETPQDTLSQCATTQFAIGWYDWRDQQRLSAKNRNTPLANNQFVIRTINE